MGLFGKSLFTKKQVKEQELYDFAQHGLLRNVEHVGLQDINLMTISGDDEIANGYLTNVEENNAKIKAAEKKNKKKLTPKEVWNLKTLNDFDYLLNTSEDYIAKNVKSLRAKQELLPKPSGKKTSINGLVFEESYGASKFGYLEIGSLIERLENRRKYEEYREFFEQFPYTRSDMINNVLSEHTNLRSKRVEEFIPDMPDEAIEKMTAYKETVKKLCGKNAVFYIIADKKDFGEIDKKRDPILLAQSPFSLAWQILGAWDEEMIYLGDL